MKRDHGIFILRIEDTDAERLSKIHRSEREDAIVLRVVERETERSNPPITVRINADADASTNAA